MYKYGWIFGLALDLIIDSLFSLHYYYIVSIKFWLYATSFLLLVPLNNGLYPS